MIELDPAHIASGAGAEVAVAGGGGRPERAVIDSREVAPGDLFIGIPGSRVDGGEFAAGALEAGAWGVIVDPARAAEMAAAGVPEGRWVFSTPDPLKGLQTLARAWRRRLGCPLVGITGSTGKTSVKDITRALLPRRVHASPENFNTEIGMPLALLSAPPETEVLVMEMAMRGLGQIEELCSIAEPDVAAITNVGPVHLELLGTVEAIAAAKAEILTGLGDGGRAVIPEDAEALAPHLHDELVTFTFGAGGDVFVERAEVADGMTRALVGTPHGEVELELPFTERHNLTNVLCSVAIAAALDIEPSELALGAARIEFSRLRGERVRLNGSSLILNDCYNANPISMRAALENLASEPPAGGAGSGRRIAVMGGMAELGPQGPSYHEEIGLLARERGIDRTVGVGDLARDYGPDEWVASPADAAPLLREMLQPGDVVLVKGSRSVGLEELTDLLRVAPGEEQDS